MKTFRHRLKVVAQVLSLMLGWVLMLWLLGGMYGCSPMSPQRWQTCQEYCSVNGGISFAHCEEVSDECQCQCKNGACFKLGALQ